MKPKLLLSFCLLILAVVIVSAQATLTFQVNMSYQIQQGKFNPNTEFVDVAGTFNGWGNTQHKLTDTDQDEIYEISISGFSEGEQIAYKFRYNSQWDGREEFPGVGNDRVHVVGSEDEILFHWYNNETPPNTTPVADVFVNLREFYEQGIITFSDRSSGNVQGWLWEFEGGTPAISTNQNPVVQYDQPGHYNVKLTVSNGIENSTIFLENYIRVLKRNTEDIPWWNETVFYEIFVRSFYDSDGNGIGDFQGIIEKLDYLNDGDPATTDDLGITGIWLMPIHKSPSYHGYDVIDYQSINPDYGTMEDFKAFLEEAHKRGIKVIIDFVLNHTSDQHEWFKNSATGKDAEKRNWYVWEDNNPSFTGPWGQKVWHESGGDYYYGLFWHGMPDLNYQEPDLKATVFEAADFWLEDIGIDGFRLDAVKFLVEEDRKLEDTQGTYLFWNEFRNHYKQTNPDAFSVGEAWTSTETVINYVKEERIDYCFEFDLAGNILYSVNEGIATNLYDQMQKVYAIYPHLQYGTFLANHDQNRIMNSLDNDENKVKLAAAIYLTLPGIPYIYYGEEIGMNGEKPDENIRRPMQWDGTVHAGFTTGTPWRGVPQNYLQYNVEKELGETASLLNWYKKVIHLRNQEKVLQLGTYKAVPTDNNKIFAYLREYEGDCMLVLHNMGTSFVQNLKVDISHTDIVLSDDLHLAGLLFDDNPISIYDFLTNGIPISGKETKIYKFIRTTVPVKDINNQSLIKLFPNPVKDQIVLEIDHFQLSEIRFSITDIRGKVWKNGFLKKWEQPTVLDISFLPKGIYSLTLKRNDFLENKKLLKL